MPLRALGYVASAVALASAHLPEAQVQMVHTLHTARRVNGADIAKARQQAERLAILGRQALPEHTVVHLTDPVKPIDIDSDAVRAALALLPEDIQARLQAGSSGKGDMVQYVAAHLQMHDTAAELLPLQGHDQTLANPRRIISLGAQSERPFYAARMACRQLGVPIPGQVDETAQLFTRHVLPPYRACREGEPHIGQLDRTFPLRQPLEWDYDPLYEIDVENPSVARDLAHIAGFLRSEGEQRFRNYLASKEETVYD